MKGVVLDASLALAWALPDERSEEAERFLASIEAPTWFWVPSLWWYEISNALLVARRRKRIVGADLANLCRIYASLPLRTDFSSGPGHLARLVAIGEKYSLSAYDAGYLELALRLDLPLASSDDALRRAARRAGVK